MPADYPDRVPGRPVQFRPFSHAKWSRKKAKLKEIVFTG